MRYLFEIAYKGTNYHGWQRQPNATTVQQVLEEALGTLLQENISIVGSGRTDTGVHCRQQFFHLDLSSPLPERFLHSLNNYLPFDISVANILTITQTGHARFSALTRKYEYHINKVKNPFMQELSYYLSRPLNIKTMNEAAALLIGEQDFESFSRVKTEVNNFICQINEAYWIENSNNLVFHIRANRFLRGMVRAIVGTLLEVGLEKKSVDDVKKTILAKDRKLAGAAAPARGLFLTKVTYPQNIFIN